MRTAVKDALLARAATQNGFITHRDVRSMGFDPVRLRQMAQRGVVEHRGYGIYSFPAIDPGPLADYRLATLWPSTVTGVLSHETALDLHGLCDVNPRRIEVTVPRRFRARRRTPPELLQLHHRDLTPQDVTSIQGIPIVTPRRAVLDGIESGLPASLLRQAIATLRGRDDLPPGDEQELFAALAARVKV